MTDSPINLDEAKRLASLRKEGDICYNSLAGEYEKAIGELVAARQRIAALEGTVARKHETARKLGRMYRERGDLIDQISELAAIEGGKP